MKKGMTRRSFLEKTAMVLGATVMPLSLSAQEATGKWSDEDRKYKFRMIGHGHIDAMWFWSWLEGMAMVHSTFRSVLDRMNENPDMKFVGSSAQFYKWVSENDPAMLQEIRKRINEGRWDIVGGFWVEPDMNMPCGESLVRQGLYAQLAFRKLVGRTAKVGFNPDSFGHNGNIPQIYKKLGMENYVFFRPNPGEKDIPAEMFWWEGPDGSRVLTYHIQDNYAATGDVEGAIRAQIGRKGQPIDTFMTFYGVGDHGGGPTKENLRSIDKLRKEHGAPEIEYGTVTGYFSEMRAKKLDLPVLKDDLQHHAVGCYTANIPIKQGNRMSETALIFSERICETGRGNWGAKYMRKRYEELWNELSLYQFHDSLAGTCDEPTTLKAEKAFGRIIDEADTMAEMALQKLEWQVPTDDAQSHYIVVFNPNAWEVETTVVHQIGWTDPLPEYQVTDGSGRQLPFQLVQPNTVFFTRKGIEIMVKIPAMGYTQVRIAPGKTPPLLHTAHAEGNVMENEYYRFAVNSDGTIALTDKATDKPLFDGKACRAIVMNDRSDTWSHTVQKYEDVAGAFKEANIDVLESGPLVVKLRVRSRYGNSSLCIDWKMLAGKKEIYADVELDWHEHRKMLKFSFPVAVTGAKSVYEIPYAAIERATDGLENPGQRWVDVTGTADGGNTRGVTLINDAKYGYSVSGSDLQLSVARSSVYCHHYPADLDMELENAYRWLDQDVHSFKMMLLPHDGDWRDANVPRHSAEFMYRPRFCYQGIHGGKLPLHDSFMEIEAPNIDVAAVKQGEDGKSMIVRCVETLGKPVETSLRIAGSGGDVKWRGSFTPFEIKTLKVTGKTVKEVNLLEE